MFFTYDEKAVLMPIMWAVRNSSPITSGLLCYGVLFIKTGTFAPWKCFMSKTWDVLIKAFADYLKSNHYIFNVDFGSSYILLLSGQPVDSTLLDSKTRTSDIAYQGKSFCDWVEALQKAPVRPRFVSHFYEPMLKFAGSSEPLKI